MFQLQNLSAAMVKTVLQEMLNHKSYTDRSFLALKERIGGYSDDQIRQFLHEIGAKKTSRADGAQEWWYLASRQEERKDRNSTSLNSSHSCASRMPASA